MMQERFQKQGLYGPLIEGDITPFEQNELLWYDQNAFGILTGGEFLVESLNKAGIKVNNKLSFLLKNDFSKIAEFDMTYEMFENFHFELEEEIYNDFWYDGKFYIYI